MITVLPIKEKERIEKLFCEHGLVYSESSCVSEAIENQKCVGLSFYNITESEITVLNIVCENNIFLVDGLLRSTLHVAVCNNIHNAFYNDTAPVEMFKKLNFISDQNEKRLNINKLFESCCCGNDKNT